MTAVDCLKRLAGTKVPKPAIGSGKRVFAIGDIHGRYDLLDALLARISRHIERGPPANNILVFLGDYVDRGPASRAVIERLCNLEQENDWKPVFLRGNHENAVLEFLNDPSCYAAWRGYGAAETLLSYGVTPPRFENPLDFIRACNEFTRKLPPRHFKFLRCLKYSHVEDDYFFAHAGIRPGVALEDQAPEDLMWIREVFLTHRGRFSKMIVHGHTPGPAPVIRSNRICIDTGAHATGWLMALVLKDKTKGFLEVRAEAPPREATLSIRAAIS